MDVLIENKLATEWNEKQMVQTGLFNNTTHSVHLCINNDCTCLHDSIFPPNSDLLCYCVCFLIFLFKNDLQFVTLQTNSLQILHFYFFNIVRFSFILKLICLMLHFQQREYKMYTFITEPLVTTAVSCVLQLESAHQTRSSAVSRQLWETP